MIDLDGFKGVNDTLGHPAGDELLHKAAETICEGSRDEDIVARPGGDEFVVLMPGCTDETGRRAGERIIKKFEQAAAAWLGAKAEQLRSMPSMSIGVASRRGSAARSADELLMYADRALYVGKESGKGCVSIYQPVYHRPTLSHSPEVLHGR